MSRRVPIDENLVKETCLRVAKEIIDDHTSDSPWKKGQYLSMSDDPILRLFLCPRRFSVLVSTAIQSRMVDWTVA
jgi:hypothetical protein